MTRGEGRGARGEKALVACVLTLVVAACGTTKKPDGKYYSDDGPPEVVPANLDKVPDATPRDEPFHRFANRPYTVFGQSYVPVVNKQPGKERGMASWYGRKFHGQKTASGETYDMFAMTAAHKTLPIPSYVRVTHLKNGRSVVVRVNDRGPFHSGRIIDLSYAAAERLGIVAAGSAFVEVERLIPGSTAAAPAQSPQPAVIEVATVSQDSAGLWLQLGVFSSGEAAESFRAKVAKDLPWILEPVSISAKDGMHRVRLGPYRNREEAAAIGEKVRTSLGFAPVMVPR